MQATSPIIMGSKKVSLKRDKFQSILASKLADGAVEKTDDDYDQFIESDELYHQKARVILKQAIPSVFCNVISMLQEIINLIFVGHLNNAEMMAGVGMGNMI
jgi:hypothetical protein